MIKYLIKSLSFRILSISKKQSFFTKDYMVFLNEQIFIIHFAVHNELQI